MEQGKNPQQTGTSYIIAGLALLALAITLAVIAWKKEIPCYRVDDPGTGVVVERKPLK